MNTLKSFDWFGLAPYGVGSPPALVLAINLYKGIMGAIDPQFWPVAAFVSGIGIVFTIMVEARTYQALARAFAEREWKAAFGAAVGALIVSGMIIYGVYSGQNTKALISSTIFSAVCYSVIMILTYLDTVKVIRAEAVKVDTIKTDNQVKLIDAQKAAKEAEARIEHERTLQANAAARAAKAQAGQSAPSIGKTQVSSGQLDKTKLDWLREFMKNNPEKQSLADIVAADGCPFTSRETARKYRAAL